ncbi:GGDEF domain-containing protein [Mesorhizobium sp. ZMM04-5]|uniref:diguanylate cyclase n=1 Tax=Mesorhizobium marinum TaxID=3228790 RepID=A0ABV3R5B8_9HYPH
MSGNAGNPTVQEWQRTAANAGLALIGCSGGALIFNYVLFRASGLPFLWTGVVSAAVISLSIAAPLLIVAARRERVLSGLRQKLNRASSADHLTDCLDSAAFTALTDAFRGGMGRSAGRRGALLVIDVDHFKQVKARFGRSWGDEALRVVSNGIRASVRSGDLVGRLGGEEFGVFLPGAGRENAEDIAERVRQVVADTLFEPGGKRCLLTVSVGGAVFEDQLIFDELIEAAEVQLHAARKQGRNRTSIGMLLPDPETAHPEMAVHEPGGARH